MMKIVITTLLGSALLQTPPPPPRPGVKAPGVRIPIERLTPEAVFPVPGMPDWIAVDEDVWISNAPKDTVARLDPRTNTVAATIPVGKRPCSGLAAAFGSLWVPNCRDQTMTRVDLKAGEVTATVRTGIGNSEGSIVAGAGSIWLTTDAKGTLARFDPATNAAGQQFAGKGGDAVRVGLGSVWLSNLEAGAVWRIDPRRVEATLPE